MSDGAWCREGRAFQVASAERRTVNVPRAGFGKGGQ